MVQFVVINKLSSQKVRYVTISNNNQWPITTTFSNRYTPRYFLLEIIACVARLNLASSTSSSYENNENNMLNHNRSNAFKKLLNLDLD